MGNKSKYMISKIFIFLFFFCFGPYSLVFGANSWLCNQGDLTAWQAWRPYAVGAWDRTLSPAPPPRHI